jgi:enoyl-CoA hydratase/carnithine racemase
MTPARGPLAADVALLRVPDAAALDRRDAAAGAKLRDALLQAADDDKIKAIVLTGLAGPVAEAVQPSQADPAARLLYTGVRGLHQVTAYCKKVVIIEVDGVCGPTASALCLDADFVLATPDSSFASPFEVTEASYPLAVLTMRANRAKAWMLRGGMLPAADAHTAGFVNQVVSAIELRDATASLARRVALMPLDGITISKMNIGAAFDVAGIGREFDTVEAAVSGGAEW